MLFDGFAYGMLLFLLSVGLSVTLGMMNFVNLAHCSFAMVGGYATVTPDEQARLAVPRHAAAAFLAGAAVSIVLERILYRKLYRASDLDQCLLTIGIVFISVAAFAWFYTTEQQSARVPDWLQGSVQVGGMSFAAYRLFLIVLGLVVTRRAGVPGRRKRASARRCARRSTTSAWRAAWASTSIARSWSPSPSAAASPAWAARSRSRWWASIPTFALAYLVYVLIVVAVGGLGSIGGSFAAAAVLGISDMAGKYYFPWLGAFLIYLVMVALLMWRPAGLVWQALTAISSGRCAGTRWRSCSGCARCCRSWSRPTTCRSPARSRSPRSSRCRSICILGYAGIVSLGHAAFFGVGAYTAGLLAKHYWSEPLTGLVLAALAAGLVGYATSHIIVRFRHLALIMLTMGLGLLLHEAANSASGLTGGADGLQGVQGGLGARLQVRHVRPHGIRLFHCWCCSSASSYAGESSIRPFGLALRGIRENATRMPAIGAPSRAHLRKAYTIAAVIAGIAGALLTHTTSTVSLEVLSFGRSADVLVILILGGAGRLYGGIIGAIIYMVARDQFSGLNPQYWYFWIGLLLVAVVMLLPNGILGGLLPSAFHEEAEQELRLARGGAGHRARRCRRACATP